MQDQITHMYIKSLDEGKILNSIVAGTLILASQGTNNFHRVHPSSVGMVSQDTAYKTTPEDLAKSIKSKYKHVNDVDALGYAKLAIKHARPDFPKAHDLLAISGIESSYNPNAKSGLKKDPARGLTQIRPSIWGLKHKDLDTPDKQMAKSADILQAYHQKLGNKYDAAHAYNVGITAFKTKSRLNPGYVEKFKKDLSLYEITPQTQM